MQLGSIVYYSLQDYSLLSCQVKACTIATGNNSFTVVTDRKVGQFVVLLTLEIPVFLCINTAFYSLYHKSNI